MRARGAQTLVKLLEDFGGSSVPFKCQVIEHFFKDFLLCCSLATLCQYLFAISGSYQREVTPFQAEILLVNQPNFKFLLENLCHFIVTLREDVR